MADQAPRGTAEASAKPRSEPARLSYVGVPRRIAWGYGYGALCLLVLGVALATHSERWMGLVATLAILAACYARCIGLRVRVAVWRRAAGDGYDVATRIAGFTTVRVAARLPELETTELDASLLPKRLAGSQIALRLKLGSSDVALPSFHAGAGFYDARDRLEPFRRALRELGEADPGTDARSEGDGDWAFPKLQGQIESKHWARGRGSPLYLRNGVALPVSPVLRAATHLFGAVLTLIALSTLLPSELSIAYRLWVVFGAGLCALLLFAVASYEVTVRLVAPQGRASALVTASHRVLGIAMYTTSIPLDGPVRLLYLGEVSETSEGTSTSTSAYVTTRDGKRQHLVYVNEENAAQREMLDAFGASLATARILDAALDALDASADDAPFEPRSYEEPASLAPPDADSQSRLNRLGAFAGILALLIGFGTFTRQLLDLRHADRWIETQYYSVEVSNGKTSRREARPTLDSNVFLEPGPGSVFRDGTPCWVIDDPHGHDIARYTAPDGPPTWRDKVRASSVAYLCMWIMAAALAAGPWIRARRSLAVRAG